MTHRLDRPPESVSRPPRVDRVDHVLQVRREVFLPKRMVLAAITRGGRGKADRAVRLEAMTGNPAAPRLMSLGLALLSRAEEGNQYCAKFGNLLV